MDRKEILQYLERQELNIQSAYASLLPLDLAYSAYVNSDQVHGVLFGTVFCYVSFKKLSSFYQMISQTNIEKMAAKIYRDYCQNPSSLQDKIQQHQKLSQALNNLWQKYQSRREDDLSRKDLLKIYQSLIQIGREWWQYGAIGEDKGGIIERAIIPNFARRHHLTAIQAREVVNLLSHPKEQAVLMRERKDFLQICLAIFKNDALAEKNFTEIIHDREVNRKLQFYLAHYFWMKTDFYQAKKITAESLLTEVKEETAKRTQSQIKREFKEIDQKFSRIEKQKKALLARLELSPEDQRDINFARLIIVWIDTRKIGMMQLFYYLFSFLEDIGQKFQLEYHALILHTIKEAEELLATGKTISEAEKARRNESLLMVFEKGREVQMFYGEEAYQMFQTAHQAKEQTIQGMIAYAGKAGKICGCVRIVLDPGKDNFQEGEILVTSMTRIEFVPLMRRAKAVITDEGGLACHAAIVAREMNMPCVVGTKIATQVLKDGDKIEIDFQTGTVKILK